MSNEVKVLSEKDGIQVQEIEFAKGEYAGYKFALPVVMTLAAAVAAYGEEAVLNSFNANASTAIRAKVKSKLVESKDNLPSKDNLLYSEEDAFSWKPGEREMSVAAILKLMKDTMKEADENKKAGNKEKYLELKNKAQDLLMKASEKMGLE